MCLFYKRFRRKSLFLILNSGQKKKTRKIFIKDKPNFMQDLNFAAFFVVNSCQPNKKI